MLFQRPPGPALRPFVELLWATDVASRPAGTSMRERMLPTGRMHLALQLEEEPFRLFAGLDDPAGHSVGFSVVAGARAAPYFKQRTAPARTVGALLRPGAAQLILGMPVDELSGRHTPLGDLWGTWEADARDRLREMPTATDRLDLFEHILHRRLPTLRGLHPAVAHALERFSVTEKVGEVVRETGYSHRRLLVLFRRAVGLSPKRYCRLLRFRRMLAMLAGGAPGSRVEQALEAGYSDQAHFNREFRQLAGLTPGDYLRRRPTHPHHVPEGQGRL